MSTTEAQSPIEQDPPLLDLESDVVHMEPPTSEVAIEMPLKSEAANDDSATMDTVRELLLGDSLKAIRRELHLTVSNLRGSMKVTNHEFKQRGDELAEQMAAIQSAMAKASEEREALTALVREQISDSSDQLKMKLAEQQGVLDVALKQVNADMELASNNHSHALDTLEKKVFAALEEYAAEFRDGKMNRSDLADMLSSLAGKVSDADR